METLTQTAPDVVEEIYGLAIRLLYVIFATA